MLKRIIWVCLLLSAILGVSAQDTVGTQASSDTLSQRLEISLITCYPGPEVYELYGHSAVRVKTPTVDIAYNYGVFNYSAPNFVYRFVKGETDYMAVAQLFDDFMRQYVWRGSKVVEQKFNLTEEEAVEFWRVLQNDVLPQNCVYRYNYVKNNCATKILDCLDKVEGVGAIYPDTVRFGTFRNEMRYYGRNYDWYQYGIDLALGKGIDYALTGREEMFVPVIMLEQMKTASRSNGEKLIKSTEVLYEGQGDATLSATPFLLSPLFVSWVAFVGVLLFVYFGIRHKRLFKGVYAMWFAVCGAAGCLIAFLVFVSEHEATSPNMLIWWLNPINLVVPVLIWFEYGRKILSIYMLLDVCFLVGLLIGSIYGEQSINAAVYPQMAATIVLAVGYLVIKNRQNRHVKVKNK